jgi:predicted DNA-binding transcriptional regulator YafY
LRAVFRAVLHGLRLRVKYQTMSGKPVAWRWIMPHALGHDGYRWHVRAWSEEGEHWGDFVLSRITKADWPVEKAAITGTKDLDWQTWIKLTLEPHRGMPVERRETISADYGMKNDRLTLRVRKAMLNYTLAHLRLPTDIGSDNEPVVSIVEKKTL